MSSWIIKFVANKLLKDNQLNRFGVEDPYYEEYTVPSENPTKPPKKLKRKREIPQGISENDQKVLQLVRNRAYRLDMWFNCLGVKVGFANVVGFIPIIGDFVAVFFSCLIYKDSLYIDHGLPYDIQFLFLFNIVVDFLLGMIPIVGDIINIGYKANSRNFLLLEKHLKLVGEKNLGIKDVEIEDTSIENHTWSEIAVGIVLAIPSALGRIFGKEINAKPTKSSKIEELGTNSTIDAYPRTPRSTGSTTTGLSSATATSSTNTSKSKSEGIVQTIY